MPQSPQRQHEIRAERKRQGLCTVKGCPNRRDGAELCTKHRAMKKRRIEVLDRLNITRGRCTKCTQPVTATNRRYCARHAKLAGQRSLKSQQRLRAEAFAAYGGAKCSCCGERHVEFLSVVQGSQGRRRFKSSAYGWLKRHSYPAGFRVLCANCAFAIRRFRRCPHQAG